MLTQGVSPFIERELQACYRDNWKDAARSSFRVAIRKFDPSSTRTLSGNTEGLRQLLKAVLLESEFVYRLEFGDGKQDDDGEHDNASKRHDLVPIDSVLRNEVEDARRQGAVFLF